METEDQGTIMMIFWFWLGGDIQKDTEKGTGLLPLMLPQFLCT